MFIALLIAAASTLTSTTRSDVIIPGVTPTTIHLGQACALKGPAAGLGQGMQAGLTACFTKVNSTGGIAGRKIELETVNDSYEPEACTAATKMLIEKSNAYALIGEVGTPTSKVAVPICTEAQVPFIGAFTGAELLRTPHNKWVVNVRASYFQETEALAKALVDVKGAKKFACFYQNDAFGQAGLEGIEKALERRGMKLVSKGQFERNTVAIATGLADVAAGAPDAVLMVGPYKPVAAFVKAARANTALQASQLCTISFVGTMDLVKELGPSAEGVVVSQVVPFPWDTSVPVVKQYHEDMKAAGLEAQIHFTSLEGYLSGRFFCEAFARVQGEPTRDALIETIQKSGAFDLGGFKLQFGAEDNQGSDAVYLTQLKGGKVEPLP
ncbi:MAG: ABC transporter substrate-binding protein [Planctomycetes bacterium]|nr:ABC transporter substrate-binding protein [Planctomycetota bacterium]